MKILMVNKFLYPRGGAESYMFTLSRALEAAGHEVQFFGMYDEKNTVGNKLGLTTSNMDFHSRSLSRFLYPFRILYSTEAKKKIGKVLDDFQPDVVHLNNVNFQLTPSIHYAVKKRGIPLVQTVHDFQMVCPNHLCYSFEEEAPCTRCLNGSKLHCLKHRCIHGSFAKSLLGVAEAWLYSALKTYRKVDLYICPSRFLEEKLVSANALFQGKTAVLHNFIVKPQIPAPLENQDPYLVFVGRLSKEKGVEMLAETARLLPECSFVAAGGGPDGKVLEGIPNLSLPGFVGGKDLTELMGRAAALVAPSVCFENCPLSILESHALGVPVVTMPYGGMAELCEDGVTGTLAEKATPEALANAIRRTLEDPTYYAALKEGCAARAKQILSAEEYAERVLAHYSTLIGGEKK